MSIQRAVVLTKTIEWLLWLANDKAAATKNGVSQSHCKDEAERLRTQLNKLGVDEVPPYKITSAAVSPVVEYIPTPANTFDSTEFGTITSTQIDATTTFLTNSHLRYRYRVVGSTVDLYTVEDLTGLYDVHGLDITGLTAGTDYEIYPQSSNDDGNSWFDVAGPFLESTAATSSVGSELPSDYATTDVASFVIPSSDIAEGSMSTTELDTITAGTLNFLNGRDHLSVVSEGGERWLRAIHKAGEIGGVTGNMVIPSAQKYRASFKVKFLTGFDFGGDTLNTQSGKFGLGLGMGRSDSGGIVSGGDTSPGGGSIRFIHRGSTIKAYVYHQGRYELLAGDNPAYGDEMPISGDNEKAENGFQIVLGQEHECIIDAEMNTPGLADGKLRVWVDNELIAVRDDILWMTGTPYSDRALLTSFHGGGTTAWAPGNDSYIQYRDIKVQAIA